MAKTLFMIIYSTIARSGPPDQGDVRVIRPRPIRETVYMYLLARLQDILGVCITSEEIFDSRS